MYFHAKSWLPSSKIDRVMDNFSKFQILNKKIKFGCFLPMPPPPPVPGSLIYTQNHRIFIELFLKYISQKCIFQKILFKKNGFFKLKKK